MKREIAAPWPRLPALEADLVGEGGEEMGRVDRAASGQHLHDVEVREGEDRREENHHREHRFDQGQRHVPEAPPRARAVHLGGLVEFAGHGHQARQHGDSEEGQAAPNVDRDDGRHRVRGLPEPVGPRRADEVQAYGSPVDDAVERVEHPEPRQGRQRSRDDEGQEHDAPDDALELEIAGQEHREPDSEHDLERERDAGDTNEFCRVCRKVSFPRMSR